MAVNTNATEACVYAVPRINQICDCAGICRVWKDAILQRRRKGGIEKSIECAVHVATETEWVRGGEPLVVVVEVFVHIDEYRVAAGQLLLIYEACEDREVIDGSN